VEYNIGFTQESHEIAQVQIQDGSRILPIIKVYMNIFEDHKVFTFGILRYHTLEESDINVMKNDMIKLILDTFKGTLFIADEWDKEPMTVTNISMQPHRVQYAFTLTLQQWKNIMCNRKKNQEKKENQEKFNELKNSFLYATAVHSNSKLILENASCQRIIEMGEIAIPFILQELKFDPCMHWALVLHSIKPEADPVPVEDYGQVDKVTNAWITWGKENNYIEK